MNTIDAAGKCVEIANAGIIIMHPFFKNIFKATSLMYFDDFKDDACKYKAMLLLQYLTNGERHVQQQDLLLNKILCGMEDDYVADDTMELEHAKIKEADELLEAVITHWTTLQNTSAAALQETFFQRKGMLSFDDSLGCWKMKVERISADILLDKIPWSTEYIQLPWMKAALITEW